MPAFVQWIENRYATCTSVTQVSAVNRYIGYSRTLFTAAASACREPTAAQPRKMRPATISLTHASHSGAMWYPSIRIFETDPLMPHNAPPSNVYITPTIIRFGVCSSDCVATVSSASVCAASARSSCADRFSRSCTCSCALRVSSAGCRVDAPPISPSESPEPLEPFRSPRAFRVTIRPAFLLCAAVLPARAPLFPR